MIQAVVKETREQKNRLDKWLNKVKDIISENEYEVFDYYETFRIGDMVLIKIKKILPVVVREGEKLVEKQDLHEFLRIAKEKLKFYASYLYDDTGFGLYEVSTAIEQHYLQHDFLAMRIGKRDIHIFNKYQSKISY